MKRIKPFRNRAHAGGMLARKLRRYRDAPGTLVLGLARGGVLVAAEVSAQLRLPCDVYVSRKLSAPEHPHAAIGAITETGVLFLDEAVLGTEPWLQRELKRFLEDEIQLREKEVAQGCRRYRQGRKIPDLHEKTVIVIDDVLFTGATFVAALDSLRKLGAKKLIGALPVGSEAAIRRIRGLADEFVVLRAQKNIKDLKEYYDDLSEATDEKVVQCLAARRNLMDGDKHRAA